jgi:hypothetical protein
MICAEREDGKRLWPPILGLYKSVVIALTYMRRNRVQAELAETFGVSRSTISRAVSAITPLLGTALADHVPTADDLDENSQYIIDGSLLPAGHGPQIRIKKPAHRKLLDWEKEFNKQVNKIRYVTVTRRTPRPA